MSPCTHGETTFRSHYHMHGNCAHTSLLTRLAHTSYEAAVEIEGPLDSMRPLALASAQHGRSSAVGRPRPVMPRACCPHAQGTVAGPLAPIRLRGSHVGLSMLAVVGFLPQVSYLCCIFAWPRSVVPAIHCAPCNLQNLRHGGAQRSLLPARGRPVRCAVAVATGDLTSDTVPGIDAVGQFAQANLVMLFHAGVA